MKRETKQKMNGVIYYLLTSFTAKRKKNKAMKSTKQNAVKADYTTTDWPYQFVWPLRQCTTQRNIF